MPESDILALFFTTSILLALSPGPDNLFVLAQSAQKGPIAGLAVVCGLCTGLMVHTVAVTLGIAVIFQTSAFAFTLLKCIGAVYLLYLAWQAFRAEGEVGNRVQSADMNIGKLWRRGIIMNITNPKVSVFFLAFLPQFTDPSKGAIAPQLLLLGGIFIIATILVFGSISLLAGTIGKSIRQSIRTQKTINRLAGAVFVGLAVKLVATQR
jgi:threonine/homoserine/homoserine lactone efflux protein